MQIRVEHAGVQRWHLLSYPLAHANWEPHSAADVQAKLQQRKIEETADADHFTSRCSSQDKPSSISQKKNTSLMSILSTPVMTAKQKQAEGPDLACEF